MQLNEINAGAPRVRLVTWSPATIRIFFPTARSTTEYVVHDDYELKRLLTKHKRNTGNLVAALVRGKYPSSNVTFDYVRHELGHV